MCHHKLNVEQYREAGCLRKNALSAQCVHSILEQFSVWSLIVFAVGTF